MNPSGNAFSRVPVKALSVSLAWHIPNKSELFRCILVLLWTASCMYLAPAALAQPIAALDSNAILGFENPAGWSLTGNSSTVPTKASTTTRTQGNSALSVHTPSNLTKVTSMPVTSTARALAGVGNVGAIFQVDLMLPLQQGNSNNSGQLQLLLSSRSRGINQVNIGTVNFSSFRLGIYNTMKFPIPPAVGSALGAAAFNDLTFQFLISSPGTGQGTYLFDNLRVHSVQLVDATLNNQPPPGYGGSVDFVVFGGTPVAHQFNIGVVQVPENFHLKLGAAAGTTVDLDLGYDGTPSFTCIYSPDTTDATGKSYALASCTGGMKAGDLVGANWANLNILGGDPSMKIRAQLALNPVGDTAGTGIIPPMPTFWGDFDGCAPVMVAAGITPPFAVVPGNTSPPWKPSPSASCAAQTNQANQIVTNYSNQFLSSQVPPVLNSQFPPDWVVPPTPELARRHGNGTPHNSTGPPPPGDPPFHYDGHANDPGSDWDAYYTLDGNYDPGQLQSGQPVKAHFDATMSGHVVLYGNDVNVVTVQATADATLNPTSSVNGSGSVNTYVFGQNIPALSTSGGGSAPVAITLFDLHGSPASFDGPGFSIHIWIFDIEVDSMTSAGLDASGKLDLTGLHFTFGPGIDAGMHAFGGVDVGFASGGVDVQIPDLFHAGIMANADATWTINTDPRQCSISAIADLSATADISSGGGHVNLVASFGKCPFCIDHSWDVFDWQGLGDTGPVPLFDPFQESIGAVELPNAASNCSVPLNVSISLPATSNGRAEFTSSPIQWTFQGNASSPNANVNVCKVTNSTRESKKVSWNGFLPGEITSGANTCSPTVLFALQASNTTSTRTITLSAEYDVTDGFGTAINPELGTTSPPLVITVTPPAPGPIITIPVTPTVQFNQQNPFPGTLFLCGVVVGGTQTTSVTWSAPVGSFTPGTVVGAGGSGVTCDYPEIWTYTPPVSPNETDTITMTARDAMGNLIGTPAILQVVFTTIN
jgi:hypothetical protein